MDANSENGLYSSKNAICVESILLGNGLLDKTYNINIMWKKNGNKKMYRRTSKSLVTCWLPKSVAIGNIWHYTQLMFEYFVILYTAFNDIHCCSSETKEVLIRENTHWYFLCCTTAIVIEGELSNFEALARCESTLKIRSSITYYE